MPWRKLSLDKNYEFISSDSLPEGLTLLDPSKLRTVNIFAFWDHWLSRQRDGLQGLVFLKSQPGDMQDKNASSWLAKGKKKAVEEDEASNEGEESGEAFDWNEGIPEENEDVHPDSPAAHTKDQITFLESLLNNKIYQGFIFELNEKIPVSKQILYL